MPCATKGPYMIVVFDFLMSLSTLSIKCKVANKHVILLGAEEADNCPSTQIDRSRPSFRRVSGTSGKVLTARHQLKVTTKRAGS